MADQLKTRRESMRWDIISTLNKARPYSYDEQSLRGILRVIYQDVSELEVRRELDYLADRKLIDVTRQPSGTWFADLTRHGVDLAEYTVDCDPGIARPLKYWET